MEEESDDLLARVLGDNLMTATLRLGALLVAAAAIAASAVAVLVG
jgi:hypothetical protein